MPGVLDHLQGGSHTAWANRRHSGWEHDNRFGLWPDHLPYLNIPLNALPRPPRSANLVSGRCLPKTGIFRYAAKTSGNFRPAPREIGRLETVHWEAHAETRFDRQFRLGKRKSPVGAYSAGAAILWAYLRRRSRCPIN